MAPPHTMRLAGRADWALMIATRDLERHGGRTPAGVYVRVAQGLHGCLRSSPCASSADVGREDPAR
jgi:hypothetical protein